MINELKIKRKLEFLNRTGTTGMIIEKDRVSLAK
jgi:hypothetical protein